MAQVPTIPLNARGGFTLFRQVAGVDVYIQESTGMFVAVVEGREHKVGRFSEMEKLIHRLVVNAYNADAMTVLSFGQLSNTEVDPIRPVVASSYDRRSGRYRNVNGELIGSLTVYYYDADRANEIRWLAARLQLLRTNYEELLAKLTPLKADPAGNILPPEQS